jgi:hypothetical protein
MGRRACAGRLPRPADVLEDVRRQMYRPEYRAYA